MSTVVFWKKMFTSSRFFLYIHVSRLRNAVFVSVILHVNKP